MPSKVSGSRTLAQEDEELLVRLAERERRLTAMVRLFRTVRLGSRSSGALMKSSLPSSSSSSPGSSGSSLGPSSPGSNHW